jgi:hypothetical protein
MVKHTGGEARQVGKQKNPTAWLGGGFLRGPCRTLLVPRRSVSQGYMGRSPDCRIILLANAFPAACPPVACPVGFRPRSQWRAREGVAPSSRKLYPYSEMLSTHSRTLSLRGRNVKEFFDVIVAAGSSRGLLQACESITDDTRKARSKCLEEALICTELLSLVPVEA